MVTLEIIPSRATFNPNEELVAWRGFQITHSNQEILERLLVRFPQTLDGLIVREASLVTYLLDRLASFILEMQNLSLQTLQAEDLDRLNCKVTDFSALGFDISPFRTRLDLIIQAHRSVVLQAEVAVLQFNYHETSGELSKVQTAISEVKAKLQEYEAKIQEYRSKLQDYESVAQNLERVIKNDADARDAAVAHLETLASSVQFDMSWSLTHDLL